MQLYSLGIGDRFARQGASLLKAFKKAEEEGVLITPVWNKSNREHQTVGSVPESVQKEADTAVKQLDWKHTYCVDADHIDLESVSAFLDCANFFTIDVAKYIGKSDAEKKIRDFVDRIAKSTGGRLNITGLNEPVLLPDDFLEKTARQYLFAIEKAREVYELIIKEKAEEDICIEISMDEVAASQSPGELFLILTMIADHDIPIDTLAPKFCGRFNKGIDYEGDVKAFAREFEADLLILKHIFRSRQPDKQPRLSVHTGSDKFSLYPVINRLIKKHNTGIHLKTAGTTWLAEAAGLASVGDEGLQLLKEIYQEAVERYDELTTPYQQVLNIDDHLLPDPEEVEQWSGARFVAHIQHDKNNKSYNPSFRQLMHTAYKIAAEKSGRFLPLLQKHRKTTGEYVFKNIYFNHLKPLFIDE